MTNKLKYYNNNPCKVLREVGEGFSEVVVYPHVQDLDMNGGEWCTACQLGSMDGAHPSHTCDPYQEVIEAINDQREDEGVVVIVDNRLLHNEMIEWRTWKNIKSKCEELTEYYNETNKKRTQLLIEKDTIENSIKTLKEDESLLHQTVESLLSKVDHNYEEYNKVSDKLINKKDKLASVTLDSKFTVDITLKELKGLIEDSVTLSQLEDGGVDNWEWYSDSLDVDKIEQDVQEQLQSYKVEIL